MIKQEISDVLNLCDGIKDPNIYLECTNKAWLTALNKIAPEKESKKRDWKRLPWFNADILAHKQQKRQMEARYIKSGSEVHKKDYQDARNIYLQKLKKAKFLYLNTAVEETQGNQKKLFGLLNSLTKEQKWNYTTGLSRKPTTTRQWRVTSRWFCILLLGKNWSYMQIL